jgi:hypothetical protein
MLELGDLQRKAKILALWIKNVLGQATQLMALSFRPIQA